MNLSIIDPSSSSLILPHGAQFEVESP